MQITKSCIDIKKVYVKYKSYLMCSSTFEIMGHFMINVHLRGNVED